MSTGFAFVLVGLTSSFVGSMLSLAVWFHYDLEGWWEQRRHERMIEHSRKLGARKQKMWQGHNASVEEFDATTKGS